jgi:hypothetical protein
LLDGYAEDALRSARYDFRMGGKMEAYLRDAGVHVDRTLTLSDRELAFDGAADAEVVAAWEDRFDRMTLLQRYCGEAFPSVRAELLHCLRSPEHRSQARVICCLGRT